jgi:hypothetical protein
LKGQRSQRQRRQRPPTLQSLSAAQTDCSPLQPLSHLSRSLHPFFAFCCPPAVGRARRRGDRGPRTRPKQRRRQTGAEGRRPWRRERDEGGSGTESAEVKSVRVQMSDLVDCRGRVAVSESERLADESGDKRGTRRQWRRRRIRCCHCSAETSALTTPFVFRLCSIPLLAPRLWRHRATRRSDSDGCRCLAVAAPSTRLQRPAPLPTLPPPRTHSLPSNWRRSAAHWSAAAD